MSAHDQNLRAHSRTDATDLASDTHAYYSVLAERLEKILLDMQQSGTSSDDPLMLRLADLLSETRALMRKKKSA
ncbi:MAG: hypothetical protein Q7T44_02475 [Parvibaculum sp.]|nr:hypothetical protein [Parvibaculum sp.]